MDPFAPRPHVRQAVAAVRAASAASGHGVYLGESTSGGPLHAPPEHMVLLLGPPRSGKTSSVVIPNVVGADGAVVVTSTKRDVLDATWHPRSLGGPCALFDPSGEISPPPGVERIGWSPLARSYTWEGAIEVVQVMLGAARPVGRGGSSADYFWSERAASLLAPTFHAGALGGLKMRDVVAWVDERDASVPQRILAKADAETAGRKLRNVCLTEPREQSGVWSTASTILGAYRSEAALAVSELPLFDATAFVHPAHGAPTLYVCASDSHQHYAAPLVVGLLDEVRKAAYERVLPAPPVLAVLDELANIAPLPDLPGILSQGASQGLVLLACLQDLSQARARWPEAPGFHTLFGTRILMPGIGDMGTLEAVSALCGDHDVRVRSTTGGSVLGRVLGRGGGASTTWSTRKERRLPVDAVARGRPGEALVLRQGYAPTHVGLTPHHLHPRWRPTTAASRESRLAPPEGTRRSQPPTIGLSR